MAIYVLALPVAIALIAFFFFVRMIVQVIRQSRELDGQLAELLAQSQTREILRQRVANSSNRRPGLPAKSILNDFELPNLWGGNITLSQWKGQSIAVLFVQPSCPFSHELVSELRGKLPTPESVNRQVIFISNGTTAENHDLFSGFTPRTPILLQETNEVARLWRVPITPAGYFFDGDRVTEGQIINGEHEILAALGIETDDPDVQDSERWKTETTRFLHQFESILPVLIAGAAAPLPVLAPYLDEELALTMSGSRTVLLLANPTCVPCQNLYPALEIQFRQFPSDLQLVMATRGDADQVQRLRIAFDLTFPIVAHPNGDVNRAFGTVETPAALLIDQHGAIVSPAVVGGAAILAMIDQARDGLL